MYCQMHLVLADYFTKPLQGELFHNLQDIIMGIVIPYTILEDVVSYSNKERVGKQIPLKQIPSETGGSIKEKDILEDKKGKLVRTYFDVDQERKATDIISNGEEGSKS